MRARITAASLACALATSAIFFALGSGAGRAENTSVDEGKHVYQRANCVGCHKWHGGGGGGYGGNALSLRATELDRDHIIETVACGRPGTGMPYFKRGAYDDASHPCYGVTRQDLGQNVPVEANIFLRPNEIAAVADYVLADVKGKGEPTYAQCIAFFGEGAHVCNVYKSAQPESPSNDGSKGASSTPARPGG
jgi:mono/diheme cytochrome c family protein